MEGFIILLILLAITCIVCGPVALIISIIALNKTKQTYRQPPRRIENPVKEEVAKPAAVIPEAIEVRQDKRAVELAETSRPEDKKKAEQEVLRAAASTWGARELGVTVRVRVLVSRMTSWAKAEVRIIQINILH